MSTDSNYIKLTRQPLTLVLAEFRFSEVLKMSNFIPDIQERLRKEYPRFTPKNEQSIEVHNEGVRVGPGINSWVFGSADRKQAILIDQNRLVFFTTEYNRFPGFQELSLTALQVVQDIVSPRLLLRVGLRYNDSVVPDDGEKLEQYIEDPWIPPPPLQKISNVLGYHKEETVVVTDIGALSVRTMIGKSNLRVMPDLAGGAHVAIVNDAPTDKLTAVLDFDHSWNADNDSICNVGKAGKILNDLHTITREAFYATTTPFARDQKWK